MKAVTNYMAKEQHDVVWFNVSYIGKGEQYVRYARADGWQVHLHVDRHDGITRIRMRHPDSVYTSDPRTMALDNSTGIG